jgi:CBS domain-containing protein
MSTNVISLDISKTVGDAAALMTEKKVRSVIVTKDDGKPFGIITERDLVRGLGKREELYFRATLLESFASRPLITTKPTTTVEEAAEVMFKNKIRRLPIVNEYGLVVGMVTVTDLAMHLSPTRRPGLTQSVLRAISRGRNV